jgi:hypothetical protein
MKKTFCIFFLGFLVMATSPKMLAAQGTIVVTPPDGLTSSGTQGGPFSPLSQTYTIKNGGDSMVSWTASKGQTWVTLSSTSGSLAAGASTTVTVSINNNANSLTPGSYSDTVAFTNTTNGIGDTTRSVSLTVNPPPTHVPTMTDWGMIILTVLLGIGSAYFLRRRISAI